MIETKNLGGIKLSTIAKICAFLTVILVLVGAGIGITRTLQAKNERVQLTAINNSLDQQGLSNQTKNLILQFAGKYNQTQNIVVTDKDDNIVYSANKKLINNMTSFVLEPDQSRMGVFDLKDSQVKFVANPRSIVPFIQKDDETQSPDNNANVNNFNNFNGGGQRQGFRQGNGFRQGMVNGGFGRNIRPSSEDRYDGHGKDGMRVTRFMGPGMMGGQAFGMMDGKLGPNQNALFLSSYKSDAQGLNIFYISKGFEQNNLMTVLFVTTILLKLLCMIFWLLLAVWVYKDSKARGLNAVLWGLLALFTGLAGLIIYLIVKHFTNFCRECGHKVGSNDNYCTECGAGLKVKCEKCGSEVKLDWNYCINCGEKLEEKQ